MDANNADLLNNVYNHSNSYLAANTLASLIPIRSSHLYQSYQNNDDISNFVNNGN